MTKKTKKPNLFEPEIPNLHIDPELIAYLKQTFSDKLPMYPYQEPVDYALRIGHLQVIAHIEAIYNKKR